MKFHKMNDIAALVWSFISWSEFYRAYPDRLSKPCADGPKVHEAHIIRRPLGIWDGVVNAPSDETRAALYKTPPKNRINGNVQEILGPALRLLGASLLPSQPPPFVFSYSITDRSRKGDVEQERRPPWLRASRWIKKPPWTSWRMAPLFSSSTSHSSLSSVSTPRSSSCSL